MLMRFNRLDEIGCLNEAFVCAGIQPSKALSEQFDVQIPVFQLDAVQIRDFELAACAWL